MGRESLHVLFFVLVSTLVSGYYYGLVDHAIVIPYMRSYYNPSLYPGDFLVAQAGYYYTFLWIILGFFTEVLGVPSTLVFFGVYLLSKFLVFYAVYLIAELLFKRRVVSYLALFFLIVNKASLGGDDMFDAILINRVPVLPFLFSR
ncbi:MAG: hypothetical protein ABH834_00025, partial [Candidatus Altiarchaeota archaeon]